MEKPGKLNQLVRQLKESAPVLYDTHTKIVYIDPETRETSYEKPSAWTFWKKHLVFLTDAGKMVDLDRLSFRYNDLQEGCEVDVLIDCRVQLIHGKIFKAALLLHREENYDSAFAAHLINWTRQFATRQEHFILHFFEREAALLNYVRQKAADHGFQIDLRITIQYMIPPDRVPPLEYFTMEETITCRIKDYHSIDLYCTLLVSLTNKNRFNMMGIKAVEPWVRRELTQIAQHVMIQKSFIDLLKNPDLSIIERELQDKMSIIGYSLQQLTSIPKVEGIKIGDFSFTTKDNQVQDGLFYHTNHRDLQVRLLTQVKGTVSSFEGKEIAKYLKPDNNLITCMRDFTIRTIREYMIGVDPGRFYMHFRHAEKDGDTTLEGELITLLKEKLRNEFNVDGAQFHFVQQETDLVRRCDALRSRFSTFIFESYTRNIRVAVDYRIESVAPEGWISFHSLRFNSPEDELAQISHLLTAKLGIRLASIPGVELMNLRGNDIEKLVGEKLFPIGAEAVKDNHGLIVKYVSATILPTEIDGAISTALDDHLREYHLKQAQGKLDTGKEQLAQPSSNPFQLPYVDKNDQPPGKMIKDTNDKPTNEE